MPKFTSNPVAEHAEVPLADEGRWEKLVDDWKARHAPPRLEGDDGGASYVVSVGASRDEEARRAQLAEILALVESQGGRVVGHELCHLAEPHPRTLLGKGAAEGIAARARAAGATMVVIDAELTPSQTRNLEDVAAIPICDREAIILNVFLKHARTRRARIQVEIAQLEYLRPRIRGVGLDMDQQTGGSVRARGPGETASELLARKLDDRLEELGKALARLRTSARTQRKERADCQRVVLVGYTNAGKTSLMNALTSAGLSARDMPFETLDTTSRCLSRHGGDVLLSDTVGFIRRLPERLLASFESTLSEVLEASLLVIVVDASDPERDLHLETTHALLERMGADHVDRFYVFNKLDRMASPLSGFDLARLSEGHPRAVLSAHDPRAVADLQSALLRIARRGQDELRTFVPYAATDVLALVYGKCRVVSSVAEGEGLRLHVEGERSVIARIQNRLEVNS